MEASKTKYELLGPVWYCVIVTFHHYQIGGSHESITSNSWTGMFQMQAANGLEKRTVGSNSAYERVPMQRL